MSDAARIVAADRTAALRRSWDLNADAWRDAVRGDRIASRAAGTNASVLDAIRRGVAGRVLDVGCGEGWLARAIAADGGEVVGIDASAALIEAARAAGGGRFEAIGYAALDRADLGAAFDVAVCNFSLLEEDIAGVLRAIRAKLRDGGRLVVQTVHPLTLAPTPYASGWQVETFAGFDAAFAAPMPWYFRTFGAWVAAIDAAGFTLVRCDEPLDGASGKPLSLLIEAVAGGR